MKWFKTLYIAYSHEPKLSFKILSNLNDGKTFITNGLISFGKNSQLV